MSGGCAEGTGTAASPDARQPPHGRCPIRAPRSPRIALGTRGAAMVTAPPPDLRPPRISPRTTGRIVGRPSALTRARPPRHRPPRQSPGSCPVVRPHPGVPGLIPGGSQPGRGVPGRGVPGRGDTGRRGTAARHRWDRGRRRGRQMSPERWSRRPRRPSPVHGPSQVPGVMRGDPGPTWPRRRQSRPVAARPRHRLARPLPPQAPRGPSPASSARKPASSRTVTPSSVAFASLEPAPGPATT